MFIYFLIFAYLLFMFWLVNYAKIKNEGWLLLPTFIILFVIAGFRSFNVGSDTISYINIFESKMNLPPLSEYFSSRFELGFLYLNDFIYNYISKSYSVFLAIYSFLTLSLMTYVIKKESPNIYLSLLIFYTFGIYTNSMTNIRNSMALAFIFLAYFFIKRNRNVLAIVSIALASTFHISALVFLIVYLFRYIRIRGAGLLVVAGVSIFSYVVARSVIENVLSIFVKYESYAESSWYTDSGKLGVILGFVIVFIVFLFGEYIFRKVKLSKGENFLRNIMILSVAISFISIQTVLLARFSFYFTAFIVLYIPLIFSKMKESDIYMRKRKVFVLLCVIVLFALRFFVILILKPEWNVLIPYRNVIIDYISSF